MSLHARPRDAERQNPDLLPTFGVRDRAKRDKRNSERRYEGGISHRAVLRVPANLARRAAAVAWTGKTLTSLNAAAKSRIWREKSRQGGGALHTGNRSEAAIGAPTSGCYMERRRR